MQSTVMSNPPVTTEAANQSLDPNNAMIQLASASEQYANANHNHITNASFVDADAAFAGGAGAAYTTNATTLHHGAPPQPLPEHPTASTSSTPNAQAHSPMQAAQGITNFTVNHAAAASTTPISVPNSNGSNPGSISNSTASNAIRDFVIPYPAPSTENLSGRKKRKTAGGSKSHQLPMFLTKTYHMIEKCDTDVATWSENGDNFVVKNVEKFASTILPQYFKHSNFSSFARQLNFYGFRKLKAEPILTADYDARTASYVRFYHEKFQKEKPELLVHIKRATKSDVQSKDDVESMRAEIQHLNDVIAGMQNEFDRRLADMYMDLNTKYGNLYQNLEAINQQIRLSQQAQAQAQTQAQAQVQAVPAKLPVQQPQTQNVQIYQAPPAPTPAAQPLKKSGTDMMQTLSQACLTLKSPALPPSHPNGVKGKQELDNFSLK